MKKIAHISDLHFGTEEIMIGEKLINDLNDLNPDLLIVSGDLTQRARKKQYQKAAEFLSAIEADKIIVPGNHDIPLFDIFSRMFLPLKRYKSHISAELTPFYSDEEIAVLGLNTARSLTWKEGRISSEQMVLLETLMCKINHRKFKILVTHHPFIPPPGNPGIALVGRSIKALKVIDKCEIDLLLAGHLHLGYSGDIRTYYPSEKRSLISVHAGTAISRRRRDQTNAFNFLTVANEKIIIEVRIFNGKSFTKSLTTIYNLQEDEWVREK